MKKIIYIFLLNVTFLQSYIQDVVMLHNKNNNRTIIFLHDYHWDDKQTSGAQELFFKKFFSALPQNALFHLEITKGPHTQKEVEKYTKNNQDESCATIFHVQQALFAGKKHNYPFKTKSFEVRNKEDTKYGVFIPYQIAFEENKEKKEALQAVNNWMRKTINKTNRMFKAPLFSQFFNKKNIKKVVKKLSHNLKMFNLPDQIQQVYKVSSVQVDIALLTNILESDNKIQVVIGGRDHLLIVADILKTFKNWQEIYAAKGCDTSVWGNKLMEHI